MPKKQTPKLKIFSPKAIGLTPTSDKNVWELYRTDKKDNRTKLVAWFAYLDFMTPPHWLAYTVSYHEGNRKVDSLVYQGNIPTNHFAKQLIKNITL